MLETVVGKCEECGKKRILWMGICSKCDEPNRTLMAWRRIIVGEVSND